MTIRVNNLKMLRALFKLLTEKEYDLYKYDVVKIQITFEGMTYYLSKEEPPAYVLKREVGNLGEVIPGWWAWTY